MVPSLNFDDTFASMLTLATIQTTEGWTMVLWDSVDAVGPDMQPIRGYSPSKVILIMVMVIIICLLFLNLFVGVVIETYNKENKSLNKNNLLTKP